VPAHSGDDRLGAVAPPSVENGAAGASTIRHRLHREVGIPDILELSPRRVEERLFEGRAPAPSLPAVSISASLDDAATIAVIQ